MYIINIDISKPVEPSWTINICHESQIVDSSFFSPTETLDTDWDSGNTYNLRWIQFLDDTSGFPTVALHTRRVFALKKECKVESMLHGWTPRQYPNPNDPKLRAQYANIYALPCCYNCAMETRRYLQQRDGLTIVQDGFLESKVEDVVPGNYCRHCRDLTAL